MGDDHANNNLHRAPTAAAASAQPQHQQKGGWAMDGPSDDASTLQAQAGAPGSANSVGLGYRGGALPPAVGSSGLTWARGASAAATHAQAADASTSPCGGQRTGGATMTGAASASGRVQESDPVGRQLSGAAGFPPELAAAWAPGGGAGGASAQIRGPPGQPEQQDEQQLGWGPQPSHGHAAAAVGGAWGAASGQGLGPYGSQAEGAAPSAYWPAPAPAMPPTAALTAWLAHQQYQEQEEQEEQEEEKKPAPKPRRQQQQRPAGPPESGPDGYSAEREGLPPHLHLQQQQGGAQAAGADGWWAALPPEELMFRRGSAPPSSTAAAQQPAPRPGSAPPLASAMSVATTTASSSTASTTSSSTASSATDATAAGAWPADGAEAGEEGEPGLGSPAWQDALIYSLQPGSASPRGAAAAEVDGDGSRRQPQPQPQPQQGQSRRAPGPASAVAAFVANNPPPAQPWAGQQGPPQPPPLYTPYQYQGAQQEPPPPPPAMNGAWCQAPTATPFANPIPGTGAMLAAASEVQASVLMMGGGGGSGPPSKRARASRPYLRHLSLQEKLDRRRANARVYSQQARERKEAEFQFYREQTTVLTMFHHLVDEAPDPLALLHPLDASGRLVYANQAFARVLHHSPEELIGSNLHSIIHPEDRVPVAERLHTLFLLPMHAPPPNAQNGAAAGAGAPGVPFLQQLPVPAPHPSPVIPVRIARRYPEGWVTARLRMRRGREGIVCSFSIVEPEAPAEGSGARPAPTPARGGEQSH